IKRRRQRHDNDISDYYYSIYYLGRVSMGHIIIIKQKLTKTGDASSTVKMTIERGGIIEVIEHNYENTNFIYPLYDSLTRTIDDMEGVHIELETNDKRFAHEIAGNPNRNSRMLEILRNKQERQNITIDAS